MNVAYFLLVVLLKYQYLVLYLKYFIKLKTFIIRLIFFVNGWDEIICRDLISQILYLPKKDEHQA